jgi:hypothetical protein
MITVEYGILRASGSLSLFVIQDERFVSLRSWSTCERVSGPGPAVLLNTFPPLSVNAKAIQKVNEESLLVPVM